MTRRDERWAAALEWRRKRLEIFAEIMKDHPEGITKDNLKDIQQKVKTKEAKESS